MTPVGEFVALLAAGIAAQWLAWRLRLPAIVLLTVAGLALGPFGALVRPSLLLGDLLRPFIELGVAVILFEGGLSLRLHELREAGKAVQRLVFPAVLLAFAGGTLAAHGLAGLPWSMAAVFGAISVVTGPTVIAPMLRQARLRRRPAAVLKWEGIVNDPLGAVLAVAVAEVALHAGAPGGWWGPALQALLGVMGGAAIGVAAAWLVVRAFRAGAVAEYLKGPVALVAAVTAFALANGLGEGSGLVASTVVGVWLGNAGLPSMEELRRFKEYLAVMLVALLFVLLTADLDRATVLALDWRAGLLVAAMILVVRPLVVWLSTIGAGLPVAERLLIGAVAPRGVVAVAVAGALGPAMAAVAGEQAAARLLPLVLALVLATVLVHGLTVAPLARRLGLAAGQARGLLLAGASPWSSAFAQALIAADVPVLIADSSWHRLRTPRLAGVPVYYGQLLSESAETRLELAEIGYLLAATDNDAYNALVCTRFAPELGRHRVWQLPSGADDEAAEVVPGLRGQIIGDEAWVYEQLLRRHFLGWRFQRTLLSDDFDFERYRQRLGEEALLVAVLEPGGGLRLPSVEAPLVAEPGEQVIAYLPPAQG